jgi:aspartyl-tRNA(Asn)/glutamyl-tRNA(Gln) amidotransferase subunit A
VLGKTVTTQFADGDPAPTHNPWHPQRTPGGSSSGSAAAVAARLVPAALGSQTAGSVLRPASFCGVVGLKPTFGRISRRNVLPFAWSLDTMGVIVRDVRDAALLLQSLAGYDALDDSSVDQPVDDYLGAADRPLKPRLGLLRDFLDRAQPDVQQVVNQSVARLVGAGADVHEARYPIDLDLAIATHHLIQISEAAELHDRALATWPSAYAPRIRAIVEAGLLVPAAAYVRAQRWRRRLRRAIDALFEQVDLLMLPTVSSVAPDLSTTGDTTYQGVWTLLGLPTMSLPCGLNGDGLPVGLQLVAPAWGEKRLLAMARWCEQVVGTLPAPPE